MAYLGVENDSATDLTTIGNMLPNLKNRAENVHFQEDLVAHCLNHL